MTDGEEPRPGPPRGVGRRWSDWRHSRPFWGGLLIVIGGAEILLSERAPLPLIIHIGVQGLAGYFIPMVMVLAGVLVLFNPVQKTFYSLLAIVLSLATWITSNLGGFFVGLLLGVLGGSLAFAWKERERPEEPERDVSPPQRPVTSVGIQLFRPKGLEDEPETDPDLALEDRVQDDDHLGRMAVVPLGLSMLAMLASPAWIVSQLGNPSGRANMIPQANLTTSQAPSGSPTLSGSLSPTPTGSPSPSPTPTPTGSGSPTPTPTPSSSPTASPSRSPSPTRSPSPRPKRRKIRHAPYAGTLNLAATERASLAAGLALFTGLTYDGVAKVPTAHGTTPMLKFTMSKLTLSDGITLQLAGDGPTSAGRGWSVELTGDVVLFVTRLSGRLDGVRVLFTPRKPPSQLAANLTLIGVIADQPVAAADLSLTGNWQLSGD